MLSQRKKKLTSFLEIKNVFLRLVIIILYPLGPQLAKFTTIVKDCHTHIA